MPRRLDVLLAVVAAASLAAGGASARELRVCADPNNLPFSNDRGEGFENKLMELVARDLGATLHYTWWAQRRGYVRNTLKAGDCDVVPGVAAGVDMLATTRPYYRSTYVFVTRADRPLGLHSFDDPRLRRLTIGVQMIGDDFSNTPPAHVLANRGIVRNVRGFMLYGDYAKPSPPESIVKAVADAKVDVAVVWGPLAGYFARREAQPLTLTAVDRPREAAVYPMAFDIAMGVRKGDAALRRELDRIIERRQGEISALLRSFGVPLLPLAPGAATTDAAASR
jgi:mxaJ protein